jgi:hypothetical protein
MSKYAELRKIDVSSKIEKKNGLSYLSWAWACDQLLQQDPMATWFYGQPVLFGETVMVFCTVNAFGKSMTAQLPVMDYRNKAIPNPDAFAVNTAMQRCLAKAIALHGIGLYIYAGEDLPQEDAEPVDASKLIETIGKSTTMDELKTSFAQAYKVASKDKEALKLINDAKELKKKELA